MNVVNSEVNRYNPRPVSGDTGAKGFGLRYPSPFFDVAQQFLPSNVQQLHKWCRYYYLTNPIINVVCSKMAEYPVTPLVYDSNDEKIQKLYKATEKTLKLREFQVEVGLDYFVYGNAFVSVFFPMQKFLVCNNCKDRRRASKCRDSWKWKNMKFKYKCPNCGHEDYAKEEDVYLKSVKDIRLIRWNPENITIKHNEITGKTRYYLKIPRAIINDVKVGDKETLETMPSEFLDAVRKRKSLLFNSDNIYHLKRPTIAQKDQGWGTPLIYPLLKDAFYLQVMKKAQESIFMEHIVPMRMIFPGQNTGGNDNPYGAYNLTNWKKKIDEEINLWKRDNNYLPVLPVNVGFQQIGGQGRALMMFQEYRMLAEQMLAGAGVPVEFIFGGLQWSGSSTSLRALENMFLGYNMQRHDLVNNFIIRKVASFMEWPKVESRFDKFKMADDLQRAMFYLQLNQAQKISDRRLLEEIGEDFDLEHERMSKELTKQLQVNRKMQVAGADIQGEAQLRSSRYQAKAQNIAQKAQAELQMEMQKMQLEMQKEQQKEQMQAQQEAQEKQQQAVAQQQAEAAKAQEAAARYQAQMQSMKLESERLKLEGDRAEAQVAKSEIPIAQQRAERAQARADEAQARAHKSEVTSVADSQVPIPDPEREFAPIRMIPGATIPVGESNPLNSMQSQIQTGAGGVDLNYIAKRAASYLRSLSKESGAQAMYQELDNMKINNPNLHKLVILELNSTKGDQTNPLDAQTNPNPTAKASPGRQVTG